MDDATLAQLTTKFEPPRPRLAPVPFGEMQAVTHGRYLVKGLIPADGLTVIWGPPKSGKSFWTTDALLHVSLGWPYRDRKVTQGAVVYVACEGAAGFGGRLEAFRRHHGLDRTDVPFYVVPARLSLVAEHDELVKAIRSVLKVDPAVVCLDTLNRSLDGSENAPDDMAKYIAAADALREALGCAVIVVHHCGTEGTRPRGHTSLTGAADAQIAVKRNDGGLVRTTVEWMKDGIEDATTTSRLQPVEIGHDEDGEEVTSCAVVATDGEASPDGANELKLTKNQATMFALLHDSGPDGMTQGDWYTAAREAGIGARRKADLTDISSALRKKGLIHRYGDVWHAQR